MRSVLFAEDHIQTPLAWSCVSLVLTGHNITLQTKNCRGNCGRKYLLEGHEENLNMHI